MGCKAAVNTSLTSISWDISNLLTNFSHGGLWVELCPLLEPVNVTLFKNRDIVGVQLRWGHWWTSLVVQWLRLCTSTAEGVGSNPGQGTKILRGAQEIKKKKKKDEVFRVGFVEYDWCSYERGGRSCEDTDLRGEPYVMTRAKTAPMQLHNRGTEDGKAALDASRGKRMLHPESQGAWPWRCLDFRLPAFKIVRRCIFVVPSPQVSATWINQPWETDSLPFCFQTHEVLSYHSFHTPGSHSQILSHSCFPNLNPVFWVLGEMLLLKRCPLSLLNMDFLHLSFLARSRGDPRLMGILKKPALCCLPQTSPLTTSSQDSVQHWAQAPTPLTYREFSGLPQSMHSQALSRHLVLFFIPSKLCSFDFYQSPPHRYVRDLTVFTI